MSKVRRRSSSVAERFIQKWIISCHVEKEEASPNIHEFTWVHIKLEKMNINEFIGMILQVLQMPDKSGRKFKGSGEYNVEKIAF